MFQSLTWCACFTEFLYGDACPNMPNRPSKLTFENIFETLQDREELAYSVPGDDMPYVPRATNRFDTPEMVCIMGDVLRRLRTLKGVRASLARDGYGKDLTLIANAKAEDCIAALTEHRDADLGTLTRSQKQKKELHARMGLALFGTV